MPEAEVLNLAVESASCGILVADERGIIMFVNREVERMFGYDRGALIGQSVEVLVPQDAAGAHRKMRADFGEDPHRRVMGGRSLRGRRKDGSEIPVEIGLTPVRSGDQTLVVSSLLDLSERTHLEHQLRQSQKMEAIGQLAGGIAHDFNNVLTVIMGHMQLMRLDMDDAHPLREELEEVLAGAQRASALTRQLLAFSRRQVLELRVIDLNALVTNLERMLRRLIGEDVVLTTALAPTLSAVRADAHQLEQVILNLAVNARDAMRGGGRLTVETTDVRVGEAPLASAPSERGDYVLLTVSDTGSGMTEEVQQRVFEPFFTTKPPGEGTGLGLATVHGIVKQSGGYVFVESEVGKGTTFRIYLPRVTEAVEAATASATEAGREAGGTETILVVDDERAVRTIVARTLKARGYHVLDAGGAAEAVALFDRHGASIDLLITDHVMPLMGGPELADQLVAKRPDLTVLLMTGYADRAIEHRDALPKPFTPERLAEKVREVLDRR